MIDELLTPSSAEFDREVAEAMVEGGVEHKSEWGKVWAPVFPYDDYRAQGNVPNNPEVWYRSLHVFASLCAEGPVKPKALQCDANGILRVTSSGSNNSVEPHENESFGSGADTGAQSFTNALAAVTLCADLSTMQFYLGPAKANLTGPITLLAGEKLSLAGTFEAYRVVNTGGLSGGYRIWALYDQP
jgi:hypothetical protein